MGQLLGTGVPQQLDVDVASRVGDRTLTPTTGTATQGCWPSDRTSRKYRTAGNHH